MTSGMTLIHVVVALDTCGETLGAMPIEVSAAGEPMTYETEDWSRALSISGYYTSYVAGGGQVSIQGIPGQHQPAGFEVVSTPRVVTKALEDQWSKDT